MASPRYNASIVMLTTSLTGEEVEHPIHFSARIMSSSNTFLLFLWFFCMSTGPTSSLQFEYHSFTERQAQDFVFYGEDARINGNALQITSLGRTNSSARILYKDRIRLRKGGFLSSFNTTFVINIAPTNRVPGEGLAFILSNGRTLPTDSYGQWLGIANADTNGSSDPSNHIVAVEFDTRKSYIDDLDDNHIGLDLNGVTSQISAQFPELRTGNDVIASITFNGTTGIMSIRYAPGNSTSSIHNQMNSKISESVNLTQYLMEDIYMGFSGSNGEGSQLSRIKAWSFYLGAQPSNNKSWMNLWILIGVLSTILTCHIWIPFFFWRRRKSRQNILVPLPIANGAPRMFKFKELKLATSNFHPDNKLGEGGFGAVHRGILKDTNEEVAVKRISKGATQGRQEFINEVTTIGGLNHKNLVRLVGWCYKSEDDFLIVYEFMPNKSLDKLLFPKADIARGKGNVLSWDKRHNIILGVANALCYLHNGCQKKVFHRDVKAANVMLDSNYNARLGDFGLARSIQHNSKTHHSTIAIAGTPGYIAPEYFLTGRANRETDIYAFGVFIMESACGRRPYSRLNDGNGTSSEIVDWLWNLYGRGRILDAADTRLGNFFNGRQMESALVLGLACCHPNPSERPSMKLAIQVLGEGVSPPQLPMEKPAFIWPAVNISFGEFTTIDLEE